jgi:inhibitor of KinA
MQALARANATRYDEMREPQLATPRRSLHRSPLERRCQRPETSDWSAATRDPRPETLAIPLDEPMLTFSPLGDRAVVIELGRSIDEATHRRVRAVCARLDEHPVPGFVEYVPAFASVVVHYDPARVTESRGNGAATPHASFVAALSAALTDLAHEPVPAPFVVEIPVCYGGELGPDLDDVAKLHDLSSDEVIRIHEAGDYLVYMIGFLPGFAYLGGLSERIATPRRPTPRTAVPAGSVGIGGSQTGVYPMVSPGGWHLIGRTPMPMFLADRDPPVLLRAGDHVRFRRISAEEFRDWEPAP